MTEKKLLTNEDKIRLEEQLRDLVEIQRPEILRQLQEAREQGDLSENADYDAAKNEQARIEKMISEIKYTLDNSTLIDKKQLDVKGKVSISNTVTIMDESENKEYKFTIVGSEGNDPENNMISNESPLAKAIINKKVGDVVEVKGIEKPYKVKVLKIV